MPRRIRARCRPGAAEGNGFRVTVEMTSLLGYRRRGLCLDPDLAGLSRPPHAQGRGARRDHAPPVETEAQIDAVVDAAATTEAVAAVEGAEAVVAPPTDAATVETATADLGAPAPTAESASSSRAANSTRSGSPAVVVPTIHAIKVKAIAARHAPMAHPAKLRPKAPVRPAASIATTATTAVRPLRMAPSRKVSAGPAAASALRQRRAGAFRRRQEALRGRQEVRRQTRSARSRRLERPQAAREARRGARSGFAVGGPGGSA